MYRNDTVHIETLQKMTKNCKFLQKQTKKKKKTALKCLFAKSTPKGHKMKTLKPLATLILATFAFALLGSTALAQNTIDDIEREIQMLEKQKKLLELKRQNRALQKELEQTPQQNKTQQSKKQNPQNQAPYYPQNNQNTQNPQNAPYYPSDTSGAATYDEAYQQSYKKAYQEEKTSQGYIRLEGSYGTALVASPIHYASDVSVRTNLYQANVEFGKQFSGLARTYLGTSFMEYSYKEADTDAAGKFDGQYITLHFGTDWIPKFGKSPLRGVLGAYLGFVYAEFQDKLEAVSTRLQQTTGIKSVSFSSKGFGTTLGIRLGLALDLGKHAQLEVGGRVGYNLLFGSSVGYLSTYPYALYVNGYGAITFLF